MTDRGITERAPMVRALLDGRKTQTRRLAWQRCRTCKGLGQSWQLGPSTKHNILGTCQKCEGSGQRPTIWQKVRPGDRLWVKENFRLRLDQDDVPPSQDWWKSGAWYHADDPTLEPSGCGGGAGKMRPSIFMPRWASRITLEVTATKMEGLQDISEEDAQAEGFSDGRLDDGFGPRPFGDTGLTIESPGTLVSAGGAFQMAWAKLHPDWDGYSSPEVVALTFTVHQQNIDSMEAAA